MRRRREETSVVKLSARSRSLLRFCALAVLSLGILVTPAAAQAATTTLAWGCGAETNWGQCSVPSSLGGVTAIAAGSAHSLAFKDDGTVVAWGCGGARDYGQCTVPGGLTGVTAIAAGPAQSLAVKDDGTVVAWGCGGDRDYGQCSVPGGLTGVIGVAAAVVHSVAAKADGTVAAWGCGINDRGQCSVPGGLTGVIAVAAGESHSLALKNDGTVVAWGCTGYDLDQCSVPADLTGVTAIAAGYAHNLALKSDGTVVAWGCKLGSGSYGQCDVPAGVAGVTAIAARDYDSLALKSDGTVVAWGCGSIGDRGQCNVPTGLSGVRAIAAGYVHSLALADLLDQTITFDPIADRTYGDPAFAPHAKASSGLPVSFSASGSCFFFGGLVYITSGGSCTVTASQPGGLNFNPAPHVSRTFTIARVRQSITFFPPLETKTFGDPDFVVSAFSSSGLPVSFAASGNCLVSGVTVHLTGAGSCTITASQAGDMTYEPAAVSQTFAIERAIRTISPPPPARCRVPALVGKRLVSAKRMIARRRCRTGKVSYAYSRKRKKGVVISQSRRPGRVLPARSRINLIVSRGRRR
jgi:Regulator of chromosome condensation (RCC1) repeat/PASTA domain